jgi:hypothetical protein
MATQIIRSIFAGILAGLLLFMIPFFILRILLIIFIIRAIFRLVGWRRYGWYHHPYYSRYETFSGDDQPEWIGNRRSSGRNNNETRDIKIN